jgi:UDP-N-acetylmuramate dehydrogenase
MRIIKDHSLRTLHTFGIEARAANYLKVHSEAALVEGLSLDYDPVLILGGGSNILFTDDYPGLVIHNCIKGIKVIREKENEVLVEAGAGENWHAFVQWCLEQGWGGLENLSLIPGTVGAAPIQNIGAYGVEQKDVFDSLEAIKWEDGKKQTFSSLECQFGYRYSFFKGVGKGKYVITRVRYLLTKNSHTLSTSYGAIRKELDALGFEKPTIKNISEAVINIRRSKLPDPSELGNAGSFFKNPIIDLKSYHRVKSNFPGMPSYPISEKEVKVPAGWLIDQCGWRGYRDDDAGVCENHALVLVNYNQATGTQLKKLAEAIQKSVLDTFGISIEPEVNII